MNSALERYYEKVYKGSKDSFMDLLKEKIDSGKGQFVVTANPEIFMMGKRLPEMDSLLANDKTLIVPDGIGILRGGKLLDHHFQERIPGVEICQSLLEYADQKHKSLYLFGAEQRVLDALVKRIEKEYSGIVLYGSSNGYVSDRDEVFRKIISLEPDIVLVALGTPAQELLIDKYFQPGQKGIYIGVGGSFDVLSGMKKRAPSFFIKYNLEWLYRITVEPKRLKRFWDSNVKFLFELRKEKNEHTRKNKENV